MPSVNKQWSIERLGQEDGPMNFHGWSPFIRWSGPLVAKPGDLAVSRRGNIWAFGKANVDIVAPTWTRATANFVTTGTATAGGSLVSIGAIATNGAGYRLGETVGVLGPVGANRGHWGRVKVTGVNAAGGILSAVILQPEIGPNQLGPQAVGAGYPISGVFELEDPAAPFVAVDITNAFDGLIDPGAVYRSFAPFTKGECGWIEKI